MKWKDIGLGILTGGLYNAGKAIAKASKTAKDVGEKVNETVDGVNDAVDEVSEAVEEFADSAAQSVAILGQTIAEVGMNTSSFIAEMEDLLTTKRVAPRDKDDLLDEEVERLEKLRAMEAALVNELKGLGFKDEPLPPGAFLFSHDKKWLKMHGTKYKRRLEIVTQLSVIRAGIDEILLQEPGVVTQSIHSVKEILERFNEFGQPRIEDILDSVDDNLETANEIQEEVKKLFVSRRWEAIPEAEIRPVRRKRIQQIEREMARLGRMLEKDRGLREQLQEHAERVQPRAITMTRGAERGDGSTARIDAPGTAVGAGATRDRSTPSTPPQGPGGVKNPSPIGDGPSGNGASRPTLQIDATALLALNVATRRRPARRQGPFARIGRRLKRGEMRGFYGNVVAVGGRIKAMKRRRLLLERRLRRLKFRVVDVPGVIPQILDEFRGVLEQFRTEQQPRLNTILDSTNAAVVSLTTTMGSADAVLVSVNELLGGFNANKGTIKAGAYVVISLFLLILVLGTIALARAAFGF